MEKEQEQNKELKRQRTEIEKKVRKAHLTFEHTKQYFQCL